VARVFSGPTFLRWSTLAWVTVLVSRCAWLLRGFDKPRRGKASDGGAAEERANGPVVGVEPGAVQGYEWAVVLLGTVLDGGLGAVLAGRRRTPGTR